MEETKTIEVDRDEYDWLVWFAQSADFGPADDDVRAAMAEDYESETGRKVPASWRGEE